jgi:hypothetical protein
MPDNIKITIQPAPVQQVSVKTGPPTIVTTGPSTIITTSGGGGGNSFGIVNVTGQNNVSATTNTDILRFVAGSGMNITTDPPNNIVTVTATGGSSIDQFARDTANSGFAKANTANTTADASIVFGQAAFTKANTANVTGEAAFAKANLANILAQSAFVQANLAFDRANTFANASNITSGTLAVSRGGTGQSSYSNGDLLIGNTISGGLDRANLTQGYGIIITNGNGTITIDAATGRTYYLVLSQPSDIATYNVAQQDPSTGAEVNTSVVYTGTAYSLASVFATPPGTPGTTLLPAGTYGRHFHATTDGVNNEAQIRVDLYKYASNTLETLLRSNESPIFDSGNSSVLLAWNITDSTNYALAVTDRLVWKVYARRVSGGSGSVRVTLYYEGTDRASYFPTTILAPTADEVARTSAAAAFAKANTANVTGEAAFAKANVANTTADASIVFGQAAFNKANTANITAEAAFAKANVANTTAEAAFANANNSIKTSAQIRANISNTAPINYDSTTGIISHAASGVSATIYGGANTVPVVTVSSTGHITLAANSAVNNLDASVVTTGNLVVARGGTGRSLSAITNGQLLIGNTTNSGFDLSTLTQGSGIIITNGNGTITIAASGGSAVDQYARDKANSAVQLGYPKLNVAANATLVAATTNNDTLILIQGSGILLTPNAGNSSIVISATGGSAVDQYARDKANSAVQFGYPRINVASNATLVSAVTNNDILVILAVSPISATSNSSQSSITLSHATSGITATGYGTATQIPVFVVDDKGHVTSVSNTAIAGLAASVITTGSLTVARGGTGLTPTIVNGAILIGNTVNSGFDLNTIANTGTGGILITNGQGTITLGANVIWVRGNVSNTTPILYDPATGIFSHKTSGAAAAIYGGANTVPVVTVDTFGHITLVANSAINNLDASAITTGNLVIARGGTGRSLTSVTDGQLLIGNTTNSGFDLNTLATTGTGGILVTNGHGTITLAANVTWIRGNVSNTAPINYDPATGIISHATSGIVATNAFGTATLIPKITVDDKGHVTAVTNTAIAGLDAGVITTGSLVVARGGTGLTPTIANGALLIGNTVNSGFDLNTIANTGTGGILITNGQGTITLAANVIWMRGNISATTPISYAPATGIITHATSGVGATIYGGANTIPVVTVDTFGHITLAANSAVNNLDASTITTGNLVVARGGTGRSLTSVANGQLLIGNTTNSGFDLATLTQGSGILITNGNGTITIAATGGAAVDQYARDKANAAVQLGYPKINVAANATLVAATTNNDTLFLLAGTNITLTPNAAQSSITITSTGGGSFSGVLNVASGGTGLTPTIVNGAILIGNTVNSGFDLNTIANTGTGGILVTNGQGTITLAANVIWIRGNIGAITPINYTAANGNFTHAGSGVTAAIYGGANTVPVVTVNETGHITLAANSVINNLAASVITTGNLTVDRGGTGRSLGTITNGQLLIGNTTNSGFDLNTLSSTGTGGILITNGVGTITLAANVVWVRGNVSNTTPILYDPATGIFSHKTSGVSATIYGGANTVPVVTVDTFGHITLAANSAINNLDASTVTTGTLPYTRGGTGRSLTSVSNGQLLIGNTTNNGFDLATLTQGTNITITNGNGTITIASTGGASGNGFGVINVGGTGQANVNSIKANDTLQILAGSGISITTDAAAESITINATGGAAQDQFARDTANSAWLTANSAWLQANTANLIANVRWTNGQVVAYIQGYGITMQ